MANVGTVQSVTGVVRAISEDGSERILRAGDSVAENEKIITGDGVVVIAFTDGTVLDLGGNSSIVLNDDVLSPEGEQTAQSEKSANEEVAALQDALINNPNFDPTTELPAAAAGTPATGVADNDGHSTVSVNYLNPEAPVEAGFDTIGINQEFQQPEEDLPPVIDDDSPPVIEENGRPSAGATLESVDEDDLGGKQNPISGEISDEFNAATNLYLYPSYAQGNQDDAPGDDNQGASAPTTVVGTLNASFGSDGAGDIVFNSAGQPALTSGGETVFYWVSGDGHTLIAYTSEGMLFGQSSGGGGNYPATVIFVAEITDPLTGAYSFSLEGPLDHSDGSTEDNLIVDVAYTITDSDGDTAQGALSIDIDDDSPVIELTKSSDNASEFTIDNHDEVSSAGYHNSYGYYVKTLDSGGNVISNNPSKGVIVENDVHFSHGGFTGPDTVLGYSQEQIGYFIIPNGDGRNAGLVDGQAVTFQFIGGQWQAFADIAGVVTPIVGAGSHVLFDIASLNKDGQDHMDDTNLIGNQNWEDLQIPNGDGDYNDVNINVNWSKVTVTGDAVESVSFGADGGGSSSIDFTFDPFDIAATSNGAVIRLEAKDTDGDGLNDQIVGLAGGIEILTIDGILEGAYDVNVLGAIDDGVADVDQSITVHVAATDGDGDVTLADLNININIDLNQVLVEPAAVA